MVLQYARCSVLNGSSACPQHVEETLQISFLSENELIKAEGNKLLGRR
jgi:hypothetical protein